MSDTKGYPHKQTFNIKNIKPNTKYKAWYKKGTNNSTKSKGKKE